jgi:hypothetical protein
VLLLHYGQGRLAAEVQPLNIDREDPAPTVESDVRRQLRNDYAGAVDQDVEPAELARPVDRERPIFRARDVHSDALRYAALILDFACDPDRRIPVDVADYNRRSIRRQAMSDSLTYPSASAGDHSYTPGQPWSRASNTHIRDLKLGGGFADGTLGRQIEL